MPNIQKTFKDRSKWINTRSSTIFPIYLNKKNDQVLVFQNYWRWKSNIRDINFILTLRAEDASVIDQIKYKIKEHNEISIKKIFNINFFFKGQLECEIDSNQNLKFPYPALMLFYKNSNGYESVVHSAGRHLNSNENFSSKFNESNFLSILNHDFTPVIHIFSGKKIDKKNNFISLDFLNKKNELIFTKKIENLFKKPFSSKLLFVEKYLNQIQKNKLQNTDFFIKIRFNILNIFGRLIVGNYDKKNDALFMTHTFRVHSSTDKNLITPNKKYKTTAYLPLMNLKPLKMSAKSYPTNAPTKSHYENYELKDKKKIQINKSSISTGGKKSQIFEIKVNENNFNVLEFRSKIPDRLNVEFNYYLKNSRHPTDIADGIKTCYQPKKFSHWGHGVSKNSYITYIFIANYSNSSKDVNNEKLNLSIFSNSKKINRTFNINKSSHHVLKFKNLKQKIKSDYFSWKLNCKKTNLNIYWISFDSKGSICGDHAF
jgi:hypothetical protein